MLESALSVVSLLVFIAVLLTALTEFQGKAGSTWTPPVKSPRRDSSREETK